MKIIPVAAMAAFLLCAGCGGKAKTVKPSLAGGIDLSANVDLAEVAPYYDETMIPSNIKQECVNLGRTLSESTQRYGSEYGVKFLRKNAVAPSGAPQVLVLRIVSAVSSGNAFIAHNKQVSVRTDLYKNGKLLGSDTMARSSMGGFGAGFKSSCSVLGRTVNTLGSDVALWVKERGAP